MLNKNILYHVHKEGFKEEKVYEAYKIFFGTLVSESRLKIINLVIWSIRIVIIVTDTKNRSSLVLLDSTITDFSVPVRSVFPELPAAGQWNTTGL